MLSESRFFDVMSNLNVNSCEGNQSERSQEKKEIIAEKHAEVSKPEGKSKKSKVYSNWAKIFRPWKWKRKHKSDKFLKTAETLERKISVRSSKDEVIKRGYLTEVNGQQTILEENSNAPDDGSSKNDSSVDQDVTDVTNKNDDSEVFSTDDALHNESLTKSPPPKPRARTSLGSDLNGTDANKQKPVAAKRTKINVTSSGDSVESAPPPRPSPKPHGQSDVDSETTNQQSVVVFSTNVDVINDEPDVNAANGNTNCSDGESFSVSDSDSEILYRDDTDDEDEEIAAGGLAAKVARRDTLALKLANRPDRNELEQRNIICSPDITSDARSTVKRNLSRHLSQRPTKSELLERNIIPNESPEERSKEREKVKRQLTRKLSMRPTVKELIERKVLQWHEYVEVYEVQNYDRRSEKPWTKLTPSDKASIRKELNEFKANEMEVHEESRQFTRFHKP